MSLSTAYSRPARAWSLLWQHADDHRLQRRDRRDQLHLYAGAAETHASGAGENSLFENFPVTLTDEDGDVDTDTLSVNIVDDVPTARNDTVNQLVESAPITFDVFANDTFGADGVDFRQ